MSSFSRTCCDPQISQVYWKFLLVLPIFLVPNDALADGGAPILLLANGMAFYYGSVSFVVTECLIIHFLGGIPVHWALLDSLLANIVSTLFVGLGLPLAIAGSTLGLSMILPPPFDRLLPDIGTWVYDNSISAELLYSSTVIWFAVTYLLTVRLESVVLTDCWRSRNVVPKISAMRLSQIGNRATYLQMALIIIWYFYLKTP